MFPAQLRLAGFTAAAVLLAAGAASGCGVESRCEVSGGYYLRRVPAGWDGISPLPLVVFYHGYGASAEEMMQDGALGEAVSGLGAILVAPNGVGKSWSFGAGGMARERDDVAFTQRVLDDVEKSFPINTSQVLATGFSIGGSMTWWLACNLKGRFTGFAPIAGAFWMPLPESCPAGPASIRHIHGTADTTVPLKGRSVADGKFTQGDVMESWRRRKAWNGCPNAPDSEATIGAMRCQTWSAQTCTSGHALTLCLHPGEHEIEADWVADGFRWMESVGQAH